MQAHSKTSKITVLLSIALVLCAQSTSAFDTALNNAAATYLEGEYDVALRKLEKLLASDPKNAQAHYYAGLCCMRMHEKDKAEEHFEWLETNGTDAQLKLLALTWLVRIDHHRKNIGDKHAIGPPPIAKDHGPVTKVFWFYTNWCPKCRAFREKFEAAKQTFNELTFENFNAEDPKNWSLVSKYQVKSYPTLVYLDKKGTIIVNYAAAPMGDAFARHLISLGAKAPTTRP